RRVHLRNRGRCQWLDVEVVEPGLDGYIPHRLFNLLFRARAVKRCDAILQHRELIGNQRREEIAASRQHLSEFNPNRAELLQRQAQTLTQRLTFMAIGHPEEHPPPDTKRQRDTHFGDKLVEPVAQKGANNKIEAPNFTRRHLPSSFSSRLVNASTARSTAAVSSANHATSSGPGAIRHSSVSTSAA